MAIGFTAVAMLTATAAEAQWPSPSPAPQAVGGAARAAGEPATGAAAKAADAAAGATATARLLDRSGAEVGTAKLQETPHGVLITSAFTKLPPGVHAYHVHAVGKCEPPFDSAGPHFNPTQHAHGFEAANGYHAGDLPNVVIPASGEGAAESFAEGVTLRPGSASLLDADGAALIVHANADDHHTDPAGNAGDRIACGVVRQ
jgi:Cu-Zn family superoxide dismutase